ncbi:hypothetical protein N8T08_006022 [Aspergillus melleus]|uniref:Uncharacterized protein n=1 Tax=Aspergillus melleus TaxID=138277 RepID=A0ACC3B1Q8_9EURO|nr:hypothetical protein N8T08_006022 [Aspergillus melleus]
MRTPSLFRPATAGLSAALYLWSLFEPAYGLSFNSVSEPDLDLTPLGKVALTGDFDAVSIYAYTEQSVTASVQEGSQSILTPLPNGIITTLSVADADIRVMCPFTLKDGTQKGIFLGGNFTSLGDVETQGAALFDPESKKVTALPGLSGSVSALLCDKESDSVYVGGDFRYKNTSHAVAWVDNKGWSSLSFGGFNGPVSSILKGDDGNIIFGGSFDGIGNSTSSKKNEQIVNLQNATISSDATSSKSGLSDPRNILCQTSGEDGEGKTWLLADNSPGFWRANMRFGYNPTKIRLYNTHYEGRGTKSFLLRALPDNGIMNLTYTEPGSHDKKYCDSVCPLSSNSTEKYREFHFVNGVGMRGFQIEVFEWYGDGGGLNGIQVYEDDIFAYAVSDFNEPSCADIKYPSKASQKGSWTHTESDQSQSDYLTAKVTDSSADGTSVVFEPDIKRSGNYSIVIYTPGCIQDGTCDSRGIVNVTATVSTRSKNDKPIEKLIYQNNYYEKYDTLYTGRVDASDSSFRPSVTLTPKSGQGDLTVVASRVRFNLIHASDSLNGELNGLYDFDPESKDTNSNFTDSAVNRAGLSLDEDASIKSLVSHDSAIYVGGNFSSSDVDNVMFFEKNKNATSLPQGGLNSEVTSMTALDKILYVGGNFTDTSDGGNEHLKHVAAYSFGSKSWTALGGGVNGPVSQVLALTLNVSSEINETIIGVSGDFDQLLAFDKTPSTNVSGFAVWVPSRKNWLQNLDVNQMEFAGQLSAFARVDNTSLLAGNLASAGIAAAGAVSLLYDDGLDLDPLLSSTNSSGSTHTGIYDSSSDRNLTILGGHFTTMSNNGSEVENIAILDGTQGTIYGLGAGVDRNSTVLALAVSEDWLYAGGNLTGAVGDSVLNGLVAYDLENGTYAQKQPLQFTGEDVTVNAIAPRPGSSEVYVGGNFVHAGALPCAAVCMYDPSESQWNRLGASLGGSAIALTWMSNHKLMAVGDLVVDGNRSAVATYNQKKSEWSAFDGASSSDIEGTITAFSPASKDVSTFWLAGQSKNGSSFLANYDGSEFQFTADVFEQGTSIQGLEVIPLSEKHDSVNLLNKDLILLITGQLVIPGFGNASAALFNGTVLSPFILTTGSDGRPGSMSQIFYEKTNPYTSEGKHRSNGIVVLISFCLALGCVFLIVIAGVIFNKIQRRRQGYMQAPQTYGTDRPSNMTRLPPEYLFNTLQQRNPGTPAI